MRIFVSRAIPLACWRDLPGRIPFFTLGYTLVGLIPSVRAVTLIGNVVLYLLMTFSGAVVPLEIMPEIVQIISRFSLLTHLVSLMRGLWYGARWGDLPMVVIVLAGWSIGSVAVVFWIFRWE